MHGVLFLIIGFAKTLAINGTSANAERSRFSFGWISAPITTSLVIELGRSLFRGNATENSRSVTVVELTKNIVISFNGLCVTLNRRILLSALII